MSGQSFPLPPASLEFLIFALRAEAEVRMREPAPDLARHSIDMLAILQEKTKGNVNPEEKWLLENTLTELRLRFVQSS
jgi:Domain of unknown function (DUF1844)